MANRTPLRAKHEKRKQKQEVTLDELIAKITPENRHEVFDWGSPVGKEIW